MSWNRFEDSEDIDDSVVPINTHLCIEDGAYLYLVPLSNTLTIVKLDVSDRTYSTIVTEVGAITKFYHDKVGDKLYYYQTQSIVSYVDLTDDSITDLNGTLLGVEDIFVYDGDPFAIDCSEDDLTYYKYSGGAWAAVGTIAEGGTNIYDIGGLGTNDDPTCICWDGTYFYITDNVDNLIYKYNAALDTEVATYDLAALGDGETTPAGICWDGTYFYVSFYGDVICKYNAALDNKITEYDVSGFGNANNFGIEWDGTYFYVVDNIDNSVYQYNSDFSVNIAEHDIETLSGETGPNGLTWDGTYFYVIDTNDANIYMYNSDFTILVNKSNIGALGGNDNPWGICWDDNYFFVVDLTDDSVYQYHSDLKTELGSILYSVVIGSNSYVIYQYITGDCKVFVKDLTADEVIAAALETLTSGLLIPYSENQRGITYNDNDTLSFVLKDSSDELTYLCTYEIAGDSFVKGVEYNIALMLDRNSTGFERAFDITAGTTSTIYKISTTLNNLLITQKIQSASNIVAITDNYLILADASLYALTNFINETESVKIKTEVGVVPQCQLELTNSDGYGLERGQLLEIKGDYNSIAYGTYQATYNFKDDANGADPSGWDVVETGGTVNVIAAFKNHNKVVELADNGDNNNVSMTNTFTAAKTDGTIEMWFAFNDPAEYNYIDMRGDAGGFAVFFRVFGGTFWHYSGGAWNNTAVACVADTWYHWKIEFDCGTDTYSWWVDGVLLANGVSFTTACTNIPTLSIYTRTVDSGAHTIYIDAVDYSWSDGYTTGRNKEFANQTTNEVIYQGSITDIPYEFDGTIKSVAFSDEINALDSTGVYNNKTVPAVVIELIESGCVYCETGVIVGSTTTGNVTFTRKVIKQNLDWAETQSVGQWYLSPTGNISLDTGEVYCGFNFNQDSGMMYSIPKAKDFGQAYNRATALGAYVSGVQISGVTNDTAQQALNGIIPYPPEQWVSVNDQTSLDNISSGILQREAVSEIQVEVDIGGSGMLQVGNYTNFSFTATGQRTIPEDQYVIIKNVYDVKGDTNRVLMVNSVGRAVEDVAEQNKQAISQVAEFSSMVSGNVLASNRISQSAQPTPATGAFNIWHDTDDNKTYIVYTDATVGLRKVELT